MSGQAVDENSVRAKAVIGFDASLACGMRRCLCSGEAHAMREGFVYVGLGGGTLLSFAVFAADSDETLVAKTPVGWSVHLMNCGYVGFYW